MRGSLIPDLPGCRKKFTQPIVIPTDNPLPSFSLIQARPTPPHLTSVQAEQLLARACENEAENAKRMRMGMEPVSQPMPITVDQLLRYFYAVLKRSPSLQT